VGGGYVVTLNRERESLPIIVTTVLCVYRQHTTTYLHRIPRFLCFGLKSFECVWWCACVCMRVCARVCACVRVYLCLYMGVCYDMFLYILQGGNFCTACWGRDQGRFFHPLRNQRRFFPGRISCCISISTSIYLSSIYVLSNGIKDVSSILSEVRCDYFACSFAYSSKSISMYIHLSIVYVLSSSNLCMHPCKK